VRCTVADMRSRFVDSKLNISHGIVPNVSLNVNASPLRSSDDTEEAIKVRIQKFHENLTAVQARYQVRDAVGLSCAPVV